LNIKGLRFIAQNLGNAQQNPGIGHFERSGEELPT